MMPTVCSSRLNASQHETFFDEGVMFAFRMQVYLYVLHLTSELRFAGKPSSCSYPTQNLFGIDTSPFLDQG